MTGESWFLSWAAMKSFSKGSIFPPSKTSKKSQPHGVVRRSSFVQVKSRRRTHRSTSTTSIQESHGDVAIEPLWGKKEEWQAKLNKVDYFQTVPMTPVVSSFICVVLDKASKNVGFNFLFLYFAALLFYSFFLTLTLHPCILNNKKSQNKQTSTMAADHQ